MKWLVLYFCISSLLKVLAFAWACYIWGWGDAQYGKEPDYMGVRNDRWHKRRRKAAYLAIAVGGLPELLPVAIVAPFAKKLFRWGVWKMDNGLTYRRWFPNDKR